MLNHLDDLELKHTKNLLPEYLDTVVQENISFVDAFAHLMSEELSDRKKAQEAMRLKRANLPFHKEVNDFDFSFQPKVKRSEIMDLFTLRFMDTKDNLLFIGNHHHT